MLARLSLALLLLALRGHCDDTVAATVGRHTMSRIAELLASPECHQLRAELDTPEDELGLPEQPAAESQRILARHRRDSRSQQGCSESLRHWLVTAGEVTTWDRLVRALHHIGRSDIALELGKNLNQDRSLELRRNVEGYGASVRHLSSAQLWPPRARRAPEMGELLFERHRPPRYSRELLGWLQPVVLGVLGAFAASVLLTGTLMYWCHWRRLLAS